MCETAVAGLRERLRDIVLRGAGSVDAVSADALASLAVAVEVAAVWDEHGRVFRRAWAAEADADRAVRSALGQVPGRPRSVMEQITDAGAGFVRGAVVEPVTAVWSLTAQALYDRDGWRSDVDAAVAGWFSVVGESWAHPVSGAATMLKEEVGWSHWGDGAYGAGVGAVAVAVVPLGRVRRVADAPAVTPRRVYRGPDGAQSFDDMLDLVDLAAHEDVGHTLARHVDVTNEDLVARVTTGVNFGDGTVRRTSTASRLLIGIRPNWSSPRRSTPTGPRYSRRSLAETWARGSGNDTKGHLANP